MHTENTSAQAAPNYRWTVSNALSVLRIVLTLPAALALDAGMRDIAIVIFLVAALTDVLDGYIARRYNEVSELGKILDPIADKVFVGVVVLILLVQGALPLWFVLVVLGRDILIMLGGIFVERRTGIVLPSNYPGKIAVLVLSATLLLVVAEVSTTIIEIGYGLSLTLLAVSLFLYGKRMITTLRTPSA